MALQDLEKLLIEGSEAIERDQKLSRRKFLFGTAAALGLGGCAAIAPSKEELAFYERLKFMPKGKRPITDFPEIVAGVGKEFPNIMIDAEQHKPPIGIDYYVNTSFPWTPIVAPARGRVVNANFKQDNGYNVIISHGYSHYTSHAHLSQMPLVQKDDIVERGTLIGFGSNTGSNARGIYHYHIGARVPTFYYASEIPADWIRHPNPHIHAENGHRLGTWNGNDLDSNYISGIKKANQYVNSVIDRLPQDILDEINRDRKKFKINKGSLLSLKLGFVYDLLEEGSLQKHIKEKPKQIKENLERFMNLKPIYTLFVNPERLDLYYVIIH